MGHEVFLANTAEEAVDVRVGLDVVKGADQFFDENGCEVLAKVTDGVLSPQGGIVDYPELSFAVITAPYTKYLNEENPTRKYHAFINLWNTKERIELGQTGVVTRKDAGEVYFLNPLIPLAKENGTTAEKYFLSGVSISHEGGLNQFRRLATEKDIDLVAAARLATRARSAVGKPSLRQRV